MTPFIRLITITVIVATTLLACQSSSSTQSDDDSPQSMPLTPTNSIQSLVGHPIKGLSTTIYRLTEDGTIRHISDWATYLALGYKPGDIITISDEDLSTFPLGAPLTRWVISQSDQSIYLLQSGQRYQIPDPETFSLTGASPLDITVLPDDLLATFPIASDHFPAAFQSTDNPPTVTAAFAQGNDVWWATDDGNIQHILSDVSETQFLTLPDNATGTAMLDHPNEGLLVSTNHGDIWRLIPDQDPDRILNRENAWITALASDGAGGLWIANRNFYDLDQSTYFANGGLIHLNLETNEQTGLSTDPALQSITSMSFDPTSNVLWIGTHFHGLYRFNSDTQDWHNFTTFNSPLPDNYIHDLELGADGSLWLTTRTTLSRVHDGQIDVFPSHEAFSTNDSVLHLAVDNESVWVASQHFIGNWTETDGWQLYSAFDHPYFLDDFRGVILDREGNPTSIGSRYLVYRYHDEWVARDVQTQEITSFTPGEIPASRLATEPIFPSPAQNYAAWLQAWPRPEQDNGRCMHYLQAPSGSDLEIRQQIARLQALNVSWVLINYLGPSQLLQMAPLFADADIMVIWRPFVRPFEIYPHWADDVRFLRSIGLPPYIQVYNEPSLDQEWNDQAVSQEAYLDNLAPAAQAVYDAGGYVGLQHIQPAWTRATLQRLKSEGMDEVFTRLFFIPHPYGANHPPDYDDDIISVSGFTHYTAIFEAEIGFIPMMIAGEGGWRLGQQDDTRFPQITEDLLRDYYVALFDWFQTGQLSNGDPLPDYLFAFCPWLLSDPNDPAAWFDSASGDRTLTIETVQNIPDFERSFSWDSDE